VRAQVALRRQIVGEKTLQQLRKFIRLHGRVWHCSWKRRNDWAAD
jgi:hypothetical protein